MVVVSGVRCRDQAAAEGSLRWSLCPNGVRVSGLMERPPRDCHEFCIGGGA